MCLVRVFIFIRKAEHMYEIFFILIWTENSLYPFVAYISSSLPYIPFIPSAENQTPALLISIVSIPRSSPRSSLPLTHHSKIQVRISLSPSLSMGFGAKSEEFLLHSDVLVFVFCFCFSSPIGKTHFSCSLFAVEMEL